MQQTATVLWRGPLLFYGRMVDYTDLEHGSPLSMTPLEPLSAAERTAGLNARLNAITGSTSFKSDAFGAGFEAARKVIRPPRIAVGTVVRSGVATFDYEVDIDGINVVCIMVQPQVSMGFGLASGGLLVEGTRVLVALPGAGSGIGYILGAIPWANTRTDDTKYTTFYNYPADGVDVRKNNAAYSVTHKQDSSARKVFANSYRDGDIVPGEHEMINESRCGVVATGCDVSLTGGASYVRIGWIDDYVKIRCTNFIKWTDAQSVREFNDGGFISVEGGDYAYQNELLSTETLDGPGSTKFEELKDKEPRPRTRFWKGFLGNLYSFFCIRPRKKPDNEDAGLASIHMSQAGNIMIRSAGGMSLERYDRIPVPHRLKAEWDPKGDVESKVEHKPIRPFKLNDDPHAAGLVKAGKMAWEQKSMYQRFDELKKDFSVKDEEEIDPLENKDGDPLESEELQMNEYDGRKAGVFIGEDGSIMLRDAWGSEISMVGGNIVINTPGSVICTANRDIVSMAGRGVVARGEEAVELSADGGDARIHAGNVVEIAGGSDESDSGGVLIESISKSESPELFAKAKAGSDAVVNGVVIKSKSGVGVYGNDVYARAEKHMALGTDENDGRLFMSAGTLVQTAAEFSCTACGDSVVAMTDSSVIASGKGAYVVGDSAALASGRQMPMMVDAGAAPGRLIGVYDAFKDYPEEVTSFNKDDLTEKANFSFRTSDQAGTNTGTEPWRPNGKFTLYQPYWQVLKNRGHKLLNMARPVELSHDKVHGSECWPGNDAAESGEFVISKDTNVGKEGYSKPRDKLSDELGISRVKFSEFRV